MTINFSQACNLSKTHFKCCLLRELNAVLIQLIWICQLRVRFLVPVRFLHLPIRFRVYFFVARWLNLCQPPTQGALQTVLHISAGSLQGGLSSLVITNVMIVWYSVYSVSPGPASWYAKLATHMTPVTTTVTPSPPPSEHSLDLKCAKVSKETIVIFYWHWSRMGCSLHQVPEY